MDDDSRTVWCGNLADKVTEELLYELFLQAAPLQRVRIPTDRSGRKCNYAFITVKHEVSVDYVVQLLNGSLLFERRLNIQPRNSTQNNAAQPPAVDINNLMLMGAMLQIQQPPVWQQPHGFRRDDFKAHHQRHDRSQWNNNYRNHRPNYDRNRRRY